MTNLSSESERQFLNYKMVTDMFDFNLLLKQPNFGYKKFKDSYYLGEIDLDKNIRSGMGVCVYENSRLYEGFWINDKRQGKGFERFSNGN